MRKLGETHLIAFCLSKNLMYLSVQIRGQFCTLSIYIFYRSLLAKPVLMYMACFSVFMVTWRWLWLWRIPLTFCHCLLLVRSVQRWMEMCWQRPSSLRMCSVRKLSQWNSVCASANVFFSVLAVFLMSVLLPSCSSLVFFSSPSGIFAIGACHEDTEGTSRHTIK